MSATSGAQSVSPVLSVDRIEDGWAVLVDAEHEVLVPVAWLPQGTAEGDAVRIHFERDEAARRALGERVRKAIERLAHHNGGSGRDDIEL